MGPRPPRRTNSRLLPLLEGAAVCLMVDDDMNMQAGRGKDNSRVDTASPNLELLQVYRLLAEIGHKHKTRLAATRRAERGNSKTIPTMETANESHTREFY